jgi:hypothetical protein
MDDQRTDPESGVDMRPSITSMPRERILAGVLFLVYIGGWTLAGYLSRLEDSWPARVYWVAFVTWCAIMLVLPLVAVCLFFGIDRSPALVRGRFSIRAVLIAITLVAVVLGAIIWAAEFFNPTH